MSFIKVAELIDCFELNFVFSFSLCFFFEEGASLRMRESVPNLPNLSQSGEVRASRARLTKSSPGSVFHPHTNIEYELRAAKAEKAFSSPSPHIVVGFAL